MKKKLASIAALMLVAALLIPVFASAETVKMAREGGSLKLRKGPGTGYGVAGYVDDGDTIIVLSQGGVWSKVENDLGKIGYIKNLYISGNGSSYADGTTYYSSRYTGYVKTKHSDSTVNLRAGAGTSTSVVKKLANGAKLTVLGENGSFYLVETAGGTEGFMSKSYVTKNGGSTKKTAVVTASALRMRSGAGTGYDIVATLGKGTKVTVLNKNTASWWYVQYGSKKGYMSSSYLK